MTALRLVGQEPHHTDAQLEAVATAVHAIGDATTAELLEWLDRQCLNCADPVVGHPNKRYCSKRCADATNRREYRRRHPGCRPPTYLPTAPLLSLLTCRDPDEFARQFSAEYGGTEKAAHRLWVRLVPEEQSRIEFDTADRLAMFFDRTIDELWPEEITDWDWRLAQETFPTMAGETPAEGSTA